MSNLTIFTHIVAAVLFFAGCLIVHRIEKHRRLWQKAAEEWRALAQQYSNAALQERMARCQLEQYLTAAGVDTAITAQQKNIVH